MRNATEQIHHISLPIEEALAIAIHLERTGRSTDAERLADYVLAVHPVNPEALHLKGLIAGATGRLNEAVALMENAIAHGLESPLYYRNICALYERVGRLDDSVAAGRRAVALDPTDPQSYHNLTLVHARRLELDESIACARTALFLDPTLPGPHFALAEALLLRGEFSEGWAEYEWRFQLAGVAKPMPPTDRPQWDGTPLPHCTLLLIADQGFGDAIQFSRYIPWVASRCPHLVIGCSRELSGLLRQIAPSATLFQNWNNCPVYSAWCVLSGLPRLHGTNLTSIPSREAYLRSNPPRSTLWRERISRITPKGYRTIGIVWAGRPSHHNDRIRSLALRHLHPLFDCPRTILFALQKGSALGEIEEYYGKAPLINLGPDIEDFEDTAAILQTLDLLITVDTSAAHLGGALGRSTWIMLPFAPDWRWLLGRSDSPWYSSVRLFRQNQPGDWEDVARRVRVALDDL